MRKKTSCCPFTVTEKNLGNLGYNTCRRGATLTRARGAKMFAFLPGTNLGSFGFLQKGGGSRVFRGVPKCFRFPREQT